MSAPVEPPIYEIQTLLNPVLYSFGQIQDAWLIASFLGRGKLVLCEPPERDERD